MSSTPADTVLLAAPTDADLVLQILNGRSAVFESLVERHQSLAFAVALGICGDVHHSEEIAQEAFVVAWRQLRELREPERFKFWICGIVRNVAKSFLRRETRTPLAAEGECRTTNDAIDAAPSPSEQLMAEEERALLLRHLHGLPAPYREAMVLFYHQNASLASMAEVLGISQAAAKQRLARGRAMLSVRVERALGSALRHTTPGSTFTLTVMGALAASAPPASAAPATGVLLSKTALAGSAGNLAAPFLALTGVFAGLWSLARAQTAKAQLSEERQFTARMYLRLTVICSVFGMLLGLGIAIHPGSALWVGGLTPLIIAGAAWRVGLWMSRRRQSIRTCHGDQSDTPKGSSRSTLDKPESQKSILGIITAVGCFPLVYAGLLILPDPEVPRWITGTFMGTCAGLSILTAGIVSLRPGSFRGVTLGLFTSLTTSTALLAWLLTRVWHESGRSVAETPASGLLLHCLVTLGVITLAWALHSFRHAR